MEQLEQQLKLIDDKDQRVLMTVCLNMTLFFTGSHTAEKRQAILTMFSDYQTMMDGKLNFTTNPQTGAWKNLAKVNYPTPQQWLLDLPDEPWEFIYHGGLHHRDASDVRFGILGCAKWEDDKGDLSWVSINFPLTFFADWHESVQEVLLRWVNALQPVHGFAAIATTHNHFDDYRYEPFEFAFAEQYPGLDISNAITQGIWLKADTIKGINWLTILNQELLDKVGGVAALKAIDGITVWQQGAVYVIQASERPALQTIPDSYYQLGALFEPIRIKKHADIHRSNRHQQPVFGTVDGSYLQWLARFEQKPSG